MIYVIVQAKDLKDVPDPSPHCLPFYPLVSKRLANLVNSLFQYPSDFCISLHLPCHYYRPDYHPLSHLGSCIGLICGILP